eukprot:TRINITY_DN82001_c0_g1_i1.p1 TRINITY_DN82001_c0_g1~~TRINITY_DN82001_c0_g1_i1.p1  ORF type:complete len:378 (-),score=63.77 TRINITY_DN82001_c0_g1_i1:24-1157(-)
MLVEVIAGKLFWDDTVACDSIDGKFEPKVKSSEADSAVVCLLNEDRVKRGKFSVAHYILEGHHDDGPPALDQIVETCRIIEEHLQAGRKVTVISPEGVAHASHRPFSALCTAAYPVLMKGETSSAALEPWKGVNLGFLQHSWAPTSKPAPQRSLSLEMCIRSLEVAIRQGWLDKDTFDCKAFRDLSNVWDVTWVAPGEILLLADPVSTVIDPDPATAKYLTPPASGEPSYTSFFENEGVKVLVRLNLDGEAGLKKSYDPADFTKTVRHLQVAYDDVNGGLPKKAILKKILEACEDVGKGRAAAFHCKAGFGRSGVCAGALAVHKFDIPGELMLAWLRICRPGTITTPQQANFLQSLHNREALDKFISTEPGDCCSVS